jgi:hypothetical protein
VSLDAKPARLLAQAPSQGGNQLIFQLRVHGDFCVEQLGDGAAFLGIFCCFLELGFIGARDLDLHLQVGRGDSEAGIEFFKRYGGCGLNGLGRHAGIAELARKGHAETAGVGGGDQLFRVGAGLRFKTGGKRIWRAFQDSAGRSERAFAVFQSATPMCACIPLHELFCSSIEIEELYMGRADGALVNRIKASMQWSVGLCTMVGGLLSKRNVMFEKYTEKARRTIFFARYDASQFGSPYIETEHLLMGLMREDNALTNRFLRGHNQVEAIREQIEHHTIKREKVSTSVDLPLSNECKRTLAFAAEEAVRLSHQHIGTEHLLLGLLRQESSFAAQLLKERGVLLSRVREELSAMSHESPAPATGRQPALVLSQFSTALTQSASEGKLLPLIGRDNELDRIVQALGRSTKNNPVLVGERGIGKRTIVEGLAQRLADGSGPAFLEPKTLISLDLSLVVAAVQHSARSKEFLNLVAAELMAAAAGTIFFFDELYSILAAAPPGGANEIELLLKKALLGGEVRCIAASTPEDYRLAQGKAGWLDRCFVTVEVQPPTEAEALNVLQAHKVRFERFHGVQYSEDSLAAAIMYSTRYVTNRFLPDKAIDLIDDAGALVKMRWEKTALPEELLESYKRIKLIVHRMENAIASHEFEKARFYSDEERKERKTLDELQEKHNVQNPRASLVTAAHIEEVLSRWTGMPIETIKEGVAPNRSAEGQRGGNATPDEQKRKDTKSE